MPTYIAHTSDGRRVKIKTTSLLEMACDSVYSFYKYCSRSRKDYLMRKDLKAREKLCLSMLDNIPNPDIRKDMTTLMKDEDVSDFDKCAIIAKYNKMCYLSDNNIAHILWYARMKIDHY